MTSVASTPDLPSLAHTATASTSTSMPVSPRSSPGAEGKRALTSKEVEVDKVVHDLTEEQEEDEPQVSGLGHF